MSVELLQKETTYVVIFNDVEYTVTTLEDNVSFGYTQYDVYDEEGELVRGNLEDEIVTYLEENL